MSSERLPTYRLHKPSGQAVVTLDGHDFYLGRHGSALGRARRRVRPHVADGVGQAPPSSRGYPLAAPAGR